LLGIAIEPDLNVIKLGNKPLIYFALL